MRKRKVSNVSSERRNWENIFNGLVQMLRTQQNQLQTLVKERKFLEDRIRMQHDGWASDIRVYKDQISEMKGILIFEEKKRLLEAAKADLALGSKHREVSIAKWILEHAENELADFKAWFECLSRKSSDGEDQATTSRDTEKINGRMTECGDKFINKIAEEKSSKKDERDIRRLKREYEKLALEKSSEVSALLAEKKFVWNQYNIMENDYINKLRSKQIELDRAKENIEILVSSKEQLLSANVEKDDIISRLESKVVDMEADTKRLNEEVSRLKVELESLRKFKNTQLTPFLNRCTAGAKTSDKESYKSSKDRSNISLKKGTSTVDAPSSSKDSEKGKRSLRKRKEDPVIPDSETPKLFSSNFKVPKLKNPSPSIR
ncbi:hypothetical protein L6164_024862 [Bauhinia variegata]|uniref:Uncharacterized protein n=1 Tax=Bauhinia variegata TaxID=167791 RepID=A0ACB9LZ52_BAUVA|nr:hypothetical protein L6164_024862 [Bauhinia variegata]